MNDQGLLWLITKLTTLYTVECMLAPHDQEVKTVSSHERCYPHCSAYVVLCNAILACSAYVVLFTVHILVFIFITVEYSPYGMQLCVDASNDCSPPSQCRQGCLLSLCNACVFNLWNIPSCLIVVPTL